MELRHVAAWSVAKQCGFEHRQSLMDAGVTADGIISGLDATNKTSWVGARCARCQTRHAPARADASACRPFSWHADMRPGLTAITTVQEPTSLNRKRHSTTHIRQLHQQRRSTGTQRQRAACEPRARTAIRPSDLSPIVSKRARRRRSSRTSGSTAHCDHPQTKNNAATRGAASICRPARSPVPHPRTTPRNEDASAHG